MRFFLVPHVLDDGFEAGIVFEDGVLAGVDEVCAELAGLVDADLGAGLDGVVRRKNGRERMGAAGEASYGLFEELELFGGQLLPGGL